MPGGANAGRMEIGTVFVLPRVGNRWISCRHGVVLDYCRKKKNEDDWNKC